MPVERCRAIAGARAFGLVRSIGRFSNAPIGLMANVSSGAAVDTLSISYRLGSRFVYRFSSRE